MKITANLRTGILSLAGNEFCISCNVRTLKNKTRKADEVVYSIPEGKPYDPRPFPSGEWNITAVEWQKDFGFSSDIYGPVKIRTDAYQEVKVWELDSDGDYYRETPWVVQDSGYLLHFSTSNTTLGCIRLANAANAITIGRIVESALKIKEPIILEVF